jgi:hypothetical protein
VTWIRQRHVTAFLKDLAVAPSITHEKLDELPGADRTRNYVRGLLVEHGALPRRDELTVRYAQWATSALARVSGDDHRDVVRRFIRWHLQRRMNRMETVPHGTFLRSKQTVTVTIEFLNWLNDHGITLAELQHELTKLGPVPIIADALGYHPSTIERHAIGSASTYAECIAAAREQRQTS